MSGIRGWLELKFHKSNLTFLLLPRLGISDPSPEACLQWAANILHQQWQNFMLFNMTAYETKYNI